MRSSRFNNNYVLIIVLILFVLGSGEVFADETLTVSWYDWAPHQFEDENGVLVGVNIDLITAICNRSGFKVEFIKLPWIRSLSELEMGNVDIVMSASKTEEREKYAFFSDTYFKLEYNVMFINKKDKLKFQSIKSLKDIMGADFTFGETRGSIYSDEYEVLLNNNEFLKNIETSDNSTQNVKKLIAGRIDGFIEDELGGANLLKKAEYEDKASILFPLYGEEEASAYLMFSKKSMSIDDINKINDTLKEMKADGSYQNILMKYKLSNN